MIEEWSEEYGDSTEKFLQSLNTPARTTLRVNLLKATREECQDRLREEGIESIPTTLSPSGLKTVKRFNAQSSQAFKEGWFEVQDEGSQLVSIIAGPRPGQIVIDGCAGAGGKSLHMAERMHDEGEIVAVDVDGRRLLELQHRARRAGVTCVLTILREQLQPENFIGKADLVFLDAPCSGTGTIRRNPWFKWSVTESLVSHFSELQLNILSFNAQFVKTGGKLVYVTCSLFKKENEEIVGKFLSTNSDFRYGTTIPSELSGQIQLHDGCVKLTPDRYDTDGFVLHSLQKV
jgi:16S rRNA (cytosine967-C5)-methyltransferase